MTRVLIVEDDPMVAKINKSYIESVKGFKVVEILKNGEEALKYLDENQVDLIILDVYMPKMDGLEFLKEIRQKEINCYVIMVTAAKEVEKIHDAMQLGVVDYLIKPFEYERLKKALENYNIRSKLLSGKESIDQNDIDSLMMMNFKPSENNLPKGLNRITLDRVLKYVKSNQDKSLTADDIAKGLGVTKATVRRYMNYLEGIGVVKQGAEYGALGRPLFKYKYIKS